MGNKGEADNRGGEEEPHTEEEQQGGKDKERERKERTRRKDGEITQTERSGESNKNMYGRKQKPGAGKGTIHRDRQMDRQKGTGGRGEIWENERRRETNVVKALRPQRGYHKMRAGWRLLMTPETGPSQGVRMGKPS